MSVLGKRDTHRSGVKSMWVDSGYTWEKTWPEQVAGVEPKSTWQRGSSLDGGWHSGRRLDDGSMDGGVKQRENTSVEGGRRRTVHSRFLNP